MDAHYFSPLLMVSGEVLKLRGGWLGLRALGCI